MLKSLAAGLLVLLALITFSDTALAQETYFGKNKVRYKQFDWRYIQTRHFDIYFYENAYPTAKFCAEVMESSYVEISEELHYKLQRRLPVFLYNSHNDFQQTNITSGILPEGVGGFTEAFKSRIVIPHNGSYEDLRHVLHHELVHGFQYDMLYGNMFTSLLSQRRLFNMPLWFAEGMAEYSSRHGWDYWSDMFMRDGSISGYLAPPYYLGGYLAYKQGQAMIKYLVDEYGEDKIGEIMQKGKIYLTMDRAMKASINKDQDEFFKDFEKAMKRRYWPEINKRKDPDEIAKQLTKSGEDGSYFNEKPSWSPDGDKIAIYTDKSDYTEIVLISAVDGKHLKTLVKADRNADLESLHSYVTGTSFSPDGNSIAFVAKSQGKEAIFLYSIPEDKIFVKKRFDYYNIVSPSWAPDGNKIAFAALDGHKRDLYVYDIKTDAVNQVTDDRFDDVDPTWRADSKALIFSSDRPHPETAILDSEGHPYARSGAVRPGDFVYGTYNLFEIEVASGRISPVSVGPGPNKKPRVSPDGNKIAFISNRNGIDNLYVGYLDSAKYFAVTNILGGVIDYSWAPNGQKIAMSAFHKGRFDIFVLDNLMPAGDNGVLDPTDFVKGAYTPMAEHTPEQTSPAPTPDSTVVYSIYRGITELPAPDTTTPTTADTLLVDTTVVVSATPDSLATDTVAVVDTAVLATKPEDTTAAKEPVGKTGLTDDGFVFVSDTTKSGGIDRLMEDVNTSDSGEYKPPVMEEPASFDSIPPPLPSGEYRIKPYKVKFTPDFVGGGLSYDTFFGLRGQTYFVFTDYLGNHQIYLATDLVNTIDQSNLQAYYFNFKNRTNYGIGLFHTKNYYEDSRRKLFSDRFYGLQAYAARPFSRFSRLELTASQYFIDRRYYEEDAGDPNRRENRSSKVSTANLAWVTDNILWGNTGPVNGRRAKLEVETGVNLFDASDVEYYSVEADWRKYWHFAKTFTMALRVSFGASEGRTPKQYYLGGTTNWIGRRTLDSDVYDVENLYFSDVVTPLRAVDYYGISGNRYALLNWEFRFPSIQYFIMQYPLRIGLTNVTGALFVDVGSAWDYDNFKGGTSQNGPARLQDIKTGFGFGFRANLLGFVLLRYDLAWNTDFASVSDRPTSFFSFGADF